MKTLTPYLLLCSLFLTAALAACDNALDSPPSDDQDEAGTGGSVASGGSSPHGTAGEGGESFGGGPLGGAAMDAPPEPVERGPVAIEVDGDPNGLFWDAKGKRLLIADDNGNRIVAYDNHGFSLVQELPSPSPNGAGLGQLVLTGDGATVVTRFGYGTMGDVAVVPAGGVAFTVLGLDVVRRRIGLTIAGNGTLFDSWFVRLENGDRVGAVGELSLSGTEVEVIAGLEKPVGVLAVGDSLFISDQDLGQILVAPLDDLEALEVFAEVDAPDLLSVGPHDSLFTGSTGGLLYRIDSEGQASVFESGFQNVRGVAYDAANRRLFVADHDGDESDGSHHFLHILPVGS
jgi:hypothetical protein